MAAHDNTSPDQFRDTVRQRHNTGEHFKSHEIAAMTPEQYSTVIKDSGAVQRGGPEDAMLKGQQATGGGLLTNLWEHVGDLTHRIGAEGGYDAENKIRRSLGALQHPYGFEREHQEQVASNARYMDVPLEQHQATYEKHGARYAEEHMNVPIYTKPMALGRNAALAMGMGHYGAAEEHLTKLQGIMQRPGAFKTGMSQKASVKYLQGREARGRGGA